MRLWRAAPLDRRAAPDAPGGPLWFPRRQQGDGRHDNPDRYGCLYVAEVATSAIAEQLAAFRGSGALLPSMLTRSGLPLALVALDLPDELEVVDLDDPTVLGAEGLRPSTVATRDRATTQRQAAEIHTSHGRAVGLRWWSTLESSWINWTLFDRAARRIELASTRELAMADPELREAADFLGLGAA